MNRNCCVTFLVRFVFLLVMAVPAAAQVYHVKEMNTQQISALDRDKTVVLLPDGILEEHGPYLPSYSDGYMTEKLTGQLADAIVARPGWKVLVFPVIPLGHGGANIIGGKSAFPGSFNVRMSTLRAVFMDLAEQLGGQGFRWIFIVDLHGAPNHHRALNQAGDYFHETYGGHMVHVVGLQSIYFADAQVPLTEAEQKEDGISVHAGMNETSINLFLRPDLVSPAVKSAPPYTGRNFTDLIRIAHADGWPGYFGSPRLASAAHGARLWKAISDAAISMALRILDGYDYRKELRYADEMGKDPDVSSVERDPLAHDRDLAKKQADWLRKQGLQ